MMASAASNLVDAGIMANPKTSVSKFTASDVFRLSRGGFSEGVFTAICIYIRNKFWRFSGYDLHSKCPPWRFFPTVSDLPSPDAELFKGDSVCGHGGLMCAEVSKAPEIGELVVFNPLTEETRALPPLLHPRNPVLVHISVDSAKKSYKVIVAGSSAASDEHLSRKVEVFDSSTSKWEEMCDVPGPAFGLNEHQAGVCLNGKLFFISFLESGGRGVVAFDVENGTWLQDLVTPIPWSSYSSTLQLVESDGKLFLFSEQEPYQSVDHCIDELEFPDPEAGVSTCRLRNVVKGKKLGGRGLQVYSEHICVSFGEGKLCIFNTLNRDGVVYDIRDGTKCKDSEPPPANQTGDEFNISHLGESDGRLFLFFEQQPGQSVDNEAEALACRWTNAVQFKKSGARGLQVLLAIFRTLSRNQFKILLTSCIACLPTAACAEDQSIQDSLSGMWESHDLATKVAGTLLVVLTTIGARFAWKIFRRRRNPGTRFDVERGLENSAIPTRGNPLWVIRPDIHA